MSVRDDITVDTGIKIRLKALELPMKAAAAYLYDRNRLISSAGRYTSTELSIPGCIKKDTSAPSAVLPSLSVKSRPMYLE